MAISRTDQKHLKFFVNDEVVENAKKGIKIKESEVEVLPENVPDAVIDTRDF